MATPSRNSNPEFKYLPWTAYYALLRIFGGDKYHKYVTEHFYTLLIIFRYILDLDGFCGGSIIAAVRLNVPVRVLVSTNLKTSLIESLAATFPEVAITAQMISLYHGDSLEVCL